MLAAADKSSGDNVTVVDVPRNDEGDRWWWVRGLPREAAASSSACWALPRLKASCHREGNASTPACAALLADTEHLVRPAIVQGEVDRPSRLSTRHDESTYKKAEGTADTQS